MSKCQWVFRCDPKHRAQCDQAEGHGGEHTAVCPSIGWTHRFNSGDRNAESSWLPGVTFDD
jgi:hypothetical protein